MGHIRTSITLRNPRRPDLGPFFITALVDTGAMTLCLPEALAVRMQLATEGADWRDTILADGGKRRMPYLGPIEVNFENRRCFGGAIVMGDEVLLGAVNMEDLDLIICPFHRKVVVNPESPYFPSALVKCS